MLTLDDGTGYAVGRGFVLGRCPDRDELVTSGRAAPLTLADRTVSRVHARVLPSGWNLILTDAGSRTGRASAPRPATPGRPSRQVPKCRWRPAAG